MAWFQSVAVRSFLIAFVSTHIPLLSLIALVTLKPAWLTPMGVLAATLVATLMATALVLLVLWRMFRPLREAADGLHALMSHGTPLRLGAGSQDEIGRLVRVLTQALAHLDRSRMPLLKSGAHQLESRAAALRQRGGERLQQLVLLEIDGWADICADADLEFLDELQTAMAEYVHGALEPAELLMPWGQGRLLLALAHAHGNTYERVTAICQQPFEMAGDDRSFHCSAVIETRSGTAVGSASALQRLEQKLFSLRQQGLAQQVV